MKKPNSLFSKPETNSRSVSLFQAPVSADKSEKPRRSLFDSSVVRKRIEVSLPDLDKYSSNLKAKKDALTRILHTNLDKLKWEFVIEIGKAEQEEHVIIAESCFKLSSHSIIQTCQNKLGKLISLMSDSEHPSKNDGFLTKIGYFKDRMQASFDSNLAEIKSVSNELRLHTTELNGLFQECKNILFKINDLTSRMEPIIISCEFFAEYKRDDFPAALYVSRLTGLLSTVTTIKQNVLQIETLEKTLAHLSETITHVVLTDIPQWLSNCANEQQKTAIINKLKGQNNG